MDNIIPSRLPSRKQYTPLERFLSHVVVTSNGCWIWYGAKAKTKWGDYGLCCLSDTNRTCRAHRWSYEYFVGPIPDGLQLDHKCRNTLCVNPEHLEPVTNRVNTTRGERSLLNVKKTSRYIGVRWETHQGKGRWRADIKLNGKSYTLGRFLSEEDAHQVYMDALTDFEQHGIFPQRKRPYVRKPQKKGGD